jgi:hypothetical protein
MTYLQKGENDEDMATMLMSMRGAWIGEDGVQQGFPSHIASQIYKIHHKELHMSK